MNSPIIKFIREPECRALTGLCRTTRYLMEKRGEFPSRRKLGGRSVGWALSEIHEWQEKQPKVVAPQSSNLNNG